MPLANIWEVKVVQSFPSVDEVLNIYHLYVDNPPANPVDLAMACETAMVTNFRPVLANALRFVKITVQNLGNILLTGEYVLANQLGTGGSDANPR